MQVTGSRARAVEHWVHAAAADGLVNGRTGVVKHIQVSKNLGALNIAWPQAAARHSPQEKCQLFASPTAQQQPYSLRAGTSRATELSSPRAHNCRWTWRGLFRCTRARWRRGIVGGATPSHSALQGMSLDYLRVSLSKCFEAGQGCVCCPCVGCALLTRCCQLRGSVARSVAGWVACLGHGETSRFARMKHRAA